jgi:hypothetical protein
MDAKQFLEPKEIEIDGMKFIISKIPAIQSQQVYRAIMQEAKNDGDIAMTYLTIPTVMALLSYAATVDGDEWLPLENENRINVSCSKLATLIKLEAAMIRYNFGFLFDGTLQEVLGVLRDSQQDT